MLIAETYSAFFRELDGIVNKVGYYLRQAVLVCSDDAMRHLFDK